LQDCGGSHDALESFAWKPNAEVGFNNGLDFLRRDWKNRVIGVLIIAGIRLYREGLAQMLSGCSQLTVVGAPANGRETLASLHELAPSVVIVDMATTESHVTIREVKRLSPQSAVVALGITDAEDDVLAGIEAGADGYVSREASLEDLVGVIENAAHGELKCSPAIAGSLLRRVAKLAAEPESDIREALLTVRELEIIRLIGQDLSNKQIACRLGIEVATVKNHVHNLLEKLNLHRRTDAARLFVGFAQQGRAALTPQAVKS